MEADEDQPPVPTSRIAAAIDDIRDFFLNSDHPVYASSGTPSLIGPNSVYHIGQMEVLFEERHFHYVTTPAIKQLRTEGFLQQEEVTFGRNRVIVIWRRNVRYTARLVREHVRLVEEYSSDTINKATGDYAETLTLLGLRGLHFDLVSRNAREYKGRTWRETEHDLDFIVEREGVGYGVEVKNTWPYFPPAELAIKLRLCDHLGIRPLFVARHRHSGQFDAVRNADGLLFIFKTKVFPPGQDDLTKRIWLNLRLPVAVWHDFRPQFYKTIQSFVDRRPASDQANTLNGGSQI